MRKVRIKETLKAGEVEVEKHSCVVNYYVDSILGSTRVTDGVLYALISTASEVRSGESPSVLLIIKQGMIEIKVYKQEGRE